jgi:hypothetical protein
MTTRDEYLRRCKGRAIEILNRGDIPGAAASMMSDLGRWEGAALYDHVELAYRAKDAKMFCQTVVGMRDWIEGFR